MYFVTKGRHIWPKAYQDRERDKDKQKHQVGRVLVFDDTMFDQALAAFIKFTNDPRWDWVTLDEDSTGYPPTVR